MVLLFFKVKRCLKKQQVSLEILLKHPHGKIVNTHTAIKKVNYQKQFTG